MNKFVYERMDNEQSYNASDMYYEAMLEYSYYIEWANKGDNNCKLIAEEYAELTRAMDFGTNEDVQKVLCKYTDEIYHDYINSAVWIN